MKDLVRADSTRIRLVLSAIINFANPGRSISASWMN